MDSQYQSLQTPVGSMPMYLFRSVGHFSSTDASTLTQKRKKAAGVGISIAEVRSAREVAEK